MNRFIAYGIAVLVIVLLCAAIYMAVQQPPTGVRRQSPGLQHYMMFVALACFCMLVLEASFYGSQAPDPPRRRHPAPSVEPRARRETDDEAEGPVFDWTFHRWPMLAGAVITVAFYAVVLALSRVL